MPSLPLLPLPVSVNMLMPTLRPEPRLPTTFTSAVFSATNGWFQFAVLSMMMRTFGRSALNDGSERKMSVSSLTGSKAPKPAGAASPRAAPTRAFLIVRMFIVNSQPASKRAVISEHSDLCALMHYGRRAAHAVGHGDLKIPIVVLGYELLGEAVAGGGCCAQAHAVAHGGGHAGRQAGDGDRGGRRIEVGAGAEHLLDRALGGHFRVLALLHVADGAGIHIREVDHCNGEERQHDEHHQHDEERRAFLPAAAATLAHGDPSLSLGFFTRNTTVSTARPY